MHIIQQQYIDIYIIYLISQNPLNDRKIKTVKFLSFFFAKYTTCVMNKKMQYE